jgi:flagellar hook-basal body complex protein FliE
MSGPVPIGGAVNPIGGLGRAGMADGLPGAGDIPGGSLFSKLLDEVNTLQTQAAGLERQMYEGQSVELHRVMIAAEQAGTAFELLVETRNKLVEAYQELMRMPV